MNQIVSSQTLLFITCIEIGIIMGILFDIIRIIRKIFKHPDFLVQIEDTIYWIGCALIGFYMLYIRNYAAIRPFIFIGMILGALLYFTSFSIIFMKIATAVINYIKGLIRSFIKLILIPIRALIKLIKIPLKRMNDEFENIHNYQKRKARIAKRKWYFTKAEIRTDRKLKKQKK